MIGWLRKLFGLHVHDWGMYGEPEKAKSEKWIGVSFAAQKIEVTKTIQRRICKNCGVLELKEVQLP